MSARQRHERFIALFVGLRNSLQAGNRGRQDTFARFDICFVASKIFVHIPDQIFHRVECDVALNFRFGKRIFCVNQRPRNTAFSHDRDCCNRNQRRKQQRNKRRCQRLASNKLYRSLEGSGRARFNRSPFTDSFQFLREFTCTRKAFRRTFLQRTQYDRFHVVRHTDV